MQVPLYDPGDVGDYTYVEGDTHFQEMLAHAMLKTLHSLIAQGGSDLNMFDDSDIGTLQTQFSAVAGSVGTWALQALQAAASEDSRDLVPAVPNLTSLVSVALGGVPGVVVSALPSVVEIGLQLYKSYLEHSAAHDLHMIADVLNAGLLTVDGEPLIGTGDGGGAGIDLTPLVEVLKKGLLVDPDGTTEEADLSQIAKAFQIAPRDDEHPEQGKPSIEKYLHDLLTYGEVEICVGSMPVRVFWNQGLNSDGGGA